MEILCAWPAQYLACQHEACAAFFLYRSKKKSSKKVAICCLGEVGEETRKCVGRNWFSLSLGGHGGSAGLCLLASPADGDINHLLPPGFISPHFPDVVRQ